MTRSRWMAAATIVGALLPLDAIAQGEPDRTIVIYAVEFKMRQAVADTPFPANAPDAPGFVIIPPGEEAPGEWGIDAYAFVPGTIVVNQGEEVLLQFYGVNGDEHHITIEAFGQEFTVLRGQLTEVRFVADQTGIFEIVCHDHPPTMVGHLIVLATP